MHRWLSRPISLPTGIAVALLLLTKLAIAVGLACAVIVHAPWAMVLLAIGFIAILGFIALISRYAMLGFVLMIAGGVWVCVEPGDRASTTMFSGLVCFVVAVIAAITRRSTPADAPPHTTCSSPGPVEP